MKQFYAPYTEWEDYQNGMYDGPDSNKLPSLELLAVKILINSERFFKTCQLLMIDWPVATLVNLTNTGCNRKAWLGQAACNYGYGVPEIVTRSVWGTLTTAQQEEANRVAGEAIHHFYKEYERKDSPIRKRMGKKMLSKRNTG